MQFIPRFGGPVDQLFFLSFDVLNVIRLDCAKKGVNFA